jgi:hypothetical protein
MPTGDCLDDCTLTQKVSREPQGQRRKSRAARTQTVSQPAGAGTLRRGSTSSFLKWSGRIDPVRPYVDKCVQSPRNRRQRRTLTPPRGIHWRCSDHRRLPPQRLRTPHRSGPNTLHTAPGLPSKHYGPESGRPLAAQRPLSPDTS